MLSEHKENEVVAAYLNELTKLKKAFNKIDVVFDVNFDPKSESGKELTEKALQQIITLDEVVLAFRTTLVN